MQEVKPGGLRVHFRCKPENRAANVWNNEQLQLKAKEMLDSWQGPLYVEMNRTEASDFPPPIKRQVVKKGTLQSCARCSFLPKMVKISDCCNCTFIKIGNGSTLYVTFRTFLLCDIVRCSNRRALVSLAVLVLLAVCLKDDMQ